MKKKIKGWFQCCPCLKDRKSSFFTGAAVMAGSLLICKVHRKLHKKQQKAS